MKQFLSLFLVLVFWVSLVGAEESEARKLCDAETKKKTIDRSVLKEQCVKVGKYYEDKQEYGNASWYYLLGVANDKNINEVQSKITNHFVANIAHSYILNQNLEKAKVLYTKFLKDAEVPLANKAMQDDYKLLFKLYPKQEEALKQGLTLWNKIYKPVLKVSTLILQYKKAKKEKKYKEVIEYLYESIDILKVNGLKDTLQIAELEYNIGIAYYNNKEYKKSIDVFIKIEKIYENKKSKEKSLIFLYSWIAEVYTKNKVYTKAIEYYNKKINLTRKINDTKDFLPSIINDMAKLGVSYYYNKQYTKSIDVLKNVEKVYEKNKEKQEDYIYVLGWIANNYEALQQDKQVVEYYKKELVIKKRIVGEEHSDIADIY